MRRGGKPRKRRFWIWLLLAGLVVGFGSQSVEAQTFNLTQITNTTGGASLNLFPSINADGTRIAFQSNRDLRPGSPGNADGNVEIFLFDTTTSTFTQITNTTGCGNGTPSINAAGTRIAFESDCNLTPGSPGNADGNTEIFLFDTTTGTFTQITNTPFTRFNFSPAISGAGTRIAFDSNADHTPGSPGNADGNSEIFLFDTTTGTFTQITNSTGFAFTLFTTINAAGTRIAFLSDRDLKPGSPGNADGNLEVFLFDTTTGTLTQITNTTGGNNDEPMINAAGTRIVFVSDRDLTPGSPGNADGNAELFVFDIAAGTFTQITNTTGAGGGDNPSINADGTRIAFVRTVAGSRNILLFDTTTGIFTQVTNAAGASGSDEPSINAAGTRIAFQSPRDLTPGSPGNADGNIELFLAIEAVTTPPDLTITKTHVGNFTQGQTGATYTITVSNGGTGATSGTVTVTDTVPSGLTATAISGTGWTCTQPSGPCTRSDVLAAGGSYPVITLTVNVAGNAPASVTNSAAVSGGGETNTANDTANDPTTITPQAGVADLTIAKTHSGNFTQGQTGATYTITVSNSGTGATSGTVTVTDTVPSGLTATAISGAGWTCAQPSGPCTRGDALAAGSSYPIITLTVTVAGNAAPSVTNLAAVSGGGEVNTANDTANDPTIVTPQAGVADLTIAKTHAGNFTPGQTGATYTITVSNGGTGPTSGTVTVTETIPIGLTPTAISGTGWSCTQPSGPCTRSDVLAAGASYPVITLTVNVASNAPSSVTNSATVSGGGEVNTANDIANDPTTIVAPGAVFPIPAMSSLGWAVMVALLLVAGIAAMRRRHA